MVPEDNWPLNNDNIKNSSQEYCCMLYHKYFWHMAVMLSDPGLCQNKWEKRKNWEEGEGELGGLLADPSASSYVNKRQA